MNNHTTFNRGNRIYIVRDSNVIGCPNWRWMEVWEGPNDHPIAAALRNEPQHSTITTFDDYKGVWFGKLGTRALPKWINRIPGMGSKTLDERVRLVRRFYTQQARIAQCLFGKFIGIHKMNPSEWQMDYETAEARYKPANG